MTCKHKWEVVEEILMAFEKEFLNDVGEADAWTMVINYSRWKKFYKRISDE